jgi:hypothetical protein
MKHSRSGAKTSGSTRSTPVSSRAASGADSIARLTDSARRGELVAIIGAGVSMSLTNGAIPALSWKGPIRDGFANGVQKGKFTATQAEAWKAQASSSFTAHGTPLPYASSVSATMKRLSAMTYAISSSAVSPPLGGFSLLAAAAPFQSSRVATGSDRGAPLSRGGRALNGCGMGIGGSALCLHPSFQSQCSLQT